MNIFGNTGAGEGNNKLFRNIVLASALVVAGGLFIGGSLDKAGQNGTLDRIAQSITGGGTRDLDRRLANMPRPSNEPGKVIGIRYGKIDYTATATIKPGESRFKNTLVDPSAGMPN